MPKQYHCFLKQDSFDLQRPHMLCLEATKQALADCFANIQSYKQQSCTQFGCPFSNGKNHLLQQILGLTTWSSRERHLTSAKPSSSRWKNLWRPYQPSSNSRQVAWNLGCWLSDGLVDLHAAYLRCRPSRKLWLMQRWLLAPMSVVGDQDHWR